MRFVDTNVLLCAISRAPAEQDKAKRANDILADHDLALSVQVLQEFQVQATRASRVPARSAAGQRNLAPYSHFNLISSDPPMIQVASSQRRGQLKGAARRRRNRGVRGERGEP